MLLILGGFFEPESDQLNYLVLRRVLELFLCIRNSGESGNTLFTRFSWSYFFSMFFDSHQCVGYNLEYCSHQTTLVNSWSMWWTTASSSNGGLIAEQTRALPRLHGKAGTVTHVAEAFTAAIPFHPLAPLFDLLLYTQNCRNQGMIVRKRERDPARLLWHRGSLQRSLKYYFSDIVAGHLVVPRPTMRLASAFADADLISRLQFDMFIIHEHPRQLQSSSRVVHRPTQHQCTCA